MTEKRNIAVTLYNVREELKQDFAATFAAIAKIGYKGVQLSGFNIKEHGAKEVKELLDAHEFQVAGSHVGLKSLEEEIDFVIEYTHSVGNSYVICPSIPADRRETGDDYQRMANTLSEIGFSLKDAGLTFGYHNHAFEFEKFGDQTGMDILLENSDASVVTFEPDVYWIAKAGVDPKEYLKKVSNRCPLVHIKDMANDDERGYAEIGEGIIDFAPIFDMQQQLGTVWYIVEQDTSKRGPLVSAEISFQNMRKMGRV